MIRKGIREFKELIKNRLFIKITTLVFIVSFLPVAPYFTYHFMAFLEKTKDVFSTEVLTETTALQKNVILGLLMNNFVLVSTVLLYILIMVYLKSLTVGYAKVKGNSLRKIHRVLGFKIYRRMLGSSVIYSVIIFSLSFFWSINYLLSDSSMKILASQAIEKGSIIILGVTKLFENVVHFGTQNLLMQPFIDFCHLGLYACMEGLGNQLVYIPFIIISLFFVFTQQEIIVNRSSILGGFKNSVKFVKNNFNEVAVLWIISALIMVIFNFLGLVIGDSLMNFYQPSELVYQPIPGSLFILGLVNLFKNFFINLSIVLVILLESIYYVKKKQSKS